MMMAELWGRDLALVTLAMTLLVRDSRSLFSASKRPSNGKAVAKMIEHIEYLLLNR